jgi:hypothetical protein
MAKKSQTNQVLPSLFIGASYKGKLPHFESAKNYGFFDNHIALFTAKYFWTLLSDFFSFLGPKNLF